MEDFSLNLLCRDKTHLLPSTLDSLKAQSGSFEILLLDGEGNRKLQELVKQYEGLNIRIESALDCNLSQMMNLGVARSQGKYIQFLEPGDRYISQYGISFLKELIEKEPQLITAKGVSQDARSHWLLRSKILDVGGFDEHLVFRPLLDLLCRFEKKGIAPIFCGRVLVDSPKEKLGSIFETSKILYRHFGLIYTFKWFLQGRSHTLRHIADFFKTAFLGKNNSF
jgi:glycosyltransferase involved in cell wall biosynthesis